jgi:hypothetical protein
VRGVLKLANVEWQYSLNSFAWLLRLRSGSYEIMNLVGDPEMHDLEHVHMIVAGMWRQLRANMV